MRVGFTGAHRTGKTSLVEAVSSELPAYAVIDEPYRLLEDDGHELSDPPSREDFELQLRMSIELLGRGSTHALFDRTPVDFIAYLQAGDPEAEVDLDEVRDAMAALDLLVFVPIEEPDRVVVSASEDRRLRRRVDERLRQLVVDDMLELGVDTLEVSGDVANRLRQVLRAIAAARR
jgi:predicted ATPase